MARRKIKEDGACVVGRIEYVRFTRNGAVLTLTHPWWYFWAFVPGMRRRHKEGSGRKLVVPNYYRLEKLLELLEALPLTDPERYRLDFDLTHTLMSATVQFKRRGCLRDQAHRPRIVYRKHPTDGHYATSVVLPTDVRTV